MILDIKNVDVDQKVDFEAVILPKKTIFQLCSLLENYNGDVKISNVKSKKLQDHLAALQSRCHFLDLTIDNQRDKMLRIKQVHRDADGGLFKDYQFDDNESQVIIDFMFENQTKLREISMRMCLKIADLVKISPDNWRNLAVNTCMKE